MPAAPSERSTDLRARGRRRLGAVLATVVAVAAAGLVIATVSDRPPDSVRALAPIDDRAVSTSSEAGDVEQIELLVRTALDRSVPVAERAELFHGDLPGTLSAAELIGSFDDVGEHAGARLGDSGISVRTVSADLAVVDVDFEIGLDVDGARLRSLVAQRVGGTWRLTSETLCGLAQAATMVGSNLTCPVADVSLRFRAGSPNVAAMLSRGSAERVDVGAGIPLGYWSIQTVRLDDTLWYVDYPEMSAGGGGPVGPADLIGVDIATREESGRVRLSGTDAAIVSDGTALWALHATIEANGATGPRLLARVDPRTATITGEVDTGAAAFALRAAADGVWVLEGGRVLRYAGSDPALAGTVDLGFLPEHHRTTSTPSELWVGAMDGAMDGATRVIDADTLAVRRVITPPGQLVGSGDHVWVVDPRHGSTVARRLAPDGAFEQEVELGVSAEGEPWGDGDGGLWFNGWSATGSTDTSGFAGTSIDVVARPFASHVTFDGQVDGTWWAESGNGTSWFTAGGTGLALSDVSGLTLLPTR